MKNQLSYAFVSLLIILFSACQKVEEMNQPEELQSGVKAAAVNIFNYDSFKDEMNWTFTAVPACPPAPDAWTLCSNSSNGRWGRLSWNWSACPLDPGLVSISEGNLLMTVPGAWRGGQVNSLRNDYGYGRYRAKLKAGTHSGSAEQGTCSAFFFYNSATAQEIDVEILNREGTKVHFVTHPGDYQIVYDLGQNPADAFIEYGFDWYKNKVDFFVNGNKVGTQTRSVPNQRGTIMLNHWTGNPYWSGYAPPETSVMSVDFVEHAPFLLITAPDVSGINVKRGTTLQITWSSCGDLVSGKVTLEIWKGGKLYKTIASKINNTGSYAFTIPTAYPVASTYRIKIKSVVSADYYDFGNADFAIN